MTRTFQGEAKGDGRRFAIVVSAFNDVVTRKLLSSCQATLAGAGVPADAVDVAWVPGAFEIPVAAMRLARTAGYGAVICLGAVIRGETPHFEYISAEMARGIQEVSLQTGVPAILGVLTTEDTAQALARAGGGHSDKGAEAARTALEMADLLPRLDDRS